MGTADTRHARELAAKLTGGGASALFEDVTSKANLPVSPENVMGSALRDKSAGGPSAGGEVIIVDVPLTFTGAEVNAASARIVADTAADFLGLDRADVSPKVTSARSVDLIVTVRVDDIIDSWASSSDTAAWTLGHTVETGDFEDVERPVVSAEHASTPAEVLHRAVLGLDTECGQKMISGEDDEVPVCDDAVATALTTIMGSINARAELSSSIGATKLTAGDGEVTEHTYDGEDILADDIDETEISLAVVAAAAFAGLVALTFVLYKTNKRFKIATLKAAKHSGLVRNLTMKIEQLENPERVENPVGGDAEGAPQGEAQAPRRNKFLGVF